MTKRCRYCGRKFETKRSSKNYDSYDCYVKDNPDRFSKPDVAIARYHLMADEMIKTMKRVSKELKPVKR